MNLKSQKKLASELLNMNRKVYLDDKPYIQKYYAIRKLHSTILDNMKKYLNNGNYPYKQYFYSLMEELRNDLTTKFTLKSSNYNDDVIFNELFFYKNHNDIKSLTEIYLEEKILKDKKQIELLKAMNNSIVCLFKIIEYDYKMGYVTLEDVYTHKKYRVIDISLSSLVLRCSNLNLYIYNRLITYDNITFGTGLPCIIMGDNKRLQSFISIPKYKKYSNFARCILLYDIAKKQDNIMMENYHI